MAQEKENVTLLLVDEQSTQSFQVDKKLVKYIRPALIAVPVIIAMLSIAVLILGWKHFANSRYLQEAMTQIVVLQQDLQETREFKSNELEQKILHLNERKRSLAQLEKYLLERGVELKPVVETAEVAASTADSTTENLDNDSVGGPSDEDEALSIPPSISYSKEVKNLLDVVRQVPLGLPSQGKKTSKFGPRFNPFTGEVSTEFHSGLDFRGKIGDPVNVTADGKVDFAGVMRGYGNVVRVNHGYGYSTLYAHLSQINVKYNQEVSAGELIGLIGNTGRSTGPHLHYEVRLNNAVIDPNKFLSL